MNASVFRLFTTKRISIVAADDPYALIAFVLLFFRNNFLLELNAITVCTFL